MKLIVINSNSAGNCYILDNGKESLILECGVHFDRIKKALWFNLSKVVGCIVTHEHNDHCKAVDNVLAAGIYVYASAGTHKAMKTEMHHRARPVIYNQQFRIGGFRILPFKVMHDAAEPCGFLISHDETGNVLFVTDTYYVPNTFKNLHNVIIEANYSQEILDRRLADGVNPTFLRNRILQSHMSLKTCKDLLQANDLSTVNNIVLIHLSDSNSNADQFRSEIKMLTGKAVHVAEPGLVIDNFNKTPF